MSKETDSFQLREGDGYAGGLQRRSVGALYLIVSGRVKVHQTTAGGDEVILNVLGPGDFFGEMSLLDGLPPSPNAPRCSPAAKHCKNSS